MSDAGIGWTPRDTQHTGQHTGATRQPHRGLTGYKGGKRCRTPDSLYNALVPSEAIVQDFEGWGHIRLRVQRAIGPHRPQAPIPPYRPLTPGDVHKSASRPAQALQHGLRRPPTLRHRPRIHRYPPQGQGVQGGTQGGTGGFVQTETRNRSGERPGHPPFSPRDQKPKSPGVKGVTLAGPSARGRYPRGYAPTSIPSGPSDGSGDGEGAQ